MPTRLKADPWLGRALGRPAYRLVVTGRPSAAPLRALRRRPGRAFVYSKIPTGRVKALHALGAMGLRVVDTQVTFERAPGRLSAGAASKSLRVGKARPQDHAGVRAVAGSCFRFSRFHLDPRVPNRLAHRVKRAWAANALAGGRGDAVYVARRGRRVCGFLIALVRREKRRRVAIIDLIGVASRDQGAGVGRALVRRFMRGSRARLFRVGTQAANAPSLAFYESCGFRCRETHYVLHGMI